jgi:carbon storage regulator CsrA
VIRPAASIASGTLAAFSELTQTKERPNAAQAAKECEMLVLSRKLQQQIKIGEHITVTILRVKGNTVRVGVQAPRDVRVIRGELPKVENSTESDEALLIAAATSSMNHEGEDATTSSEEDATSEPKKSATAAAQPPAVTPAHLPLRRICHRRGMAPLKQLVAGCAALAK